MEPQILEAPVYPIAILSYIVIKISRAYTKITVD